MNYTNVAPKVTVITVCRNCEDSIEKTICSVINQSYGNLEHLILDGLSTDSTFIIAKSFLNKPKKAGYNLVCESEKDKGIYDAMNKAINKSSGEWIIFMNSGDVFHNSNVIADVFQNKDYPDQNILFGNTLALNSRQIIYPPKMVSKGYFFAETICHQSIFFRNKSFLDIGKFDLHYKIIADREWLLRAAIRKISFLYIPLVISIWDEEGFSKSNIPIYLKENNFLQVKYFNSIERSFYLWKIRLRRVLVYLKRIKR